jgi:hypothetical protein
VKLSREMAHMLGVQEETALATRSLEEFGDMSERIENDDSGAAARVQQQLSPLHSHLYLLGAHVGTEAARIMTTGGEISLPPAKKISRHATLAGIAPALWQPLARMPRDETPAQVQARYRDALNALVAALAQAP